MYDSLVIGGGLAGLMTARELYLAGQKVALYDAGMVGMESSWAGGGILSPLYPWRESEDLSELMFVSMRMYPEISNDIFESTGIDPEWQRSGMLILDVGDDENARLWAERHHYPFEFINDSCLYQQFNLSPVTGGKTVWLPEVAQVRNPRLIKALKSYLLKAGVSIYEHSRVNRFRISGGRLQEIETDSGNVEAPVVVLSAGAWCSELLPETRIRPVRGQMLGYQATEDFLPCILLKENIYAIPRKDGLILVGSSVEDVGFDKTTTTEIRDLLMEKITTLLPELGQFPIKAHWSGLRPATPSGLPYICAHPQIEGLYLNTGHFRNGILLATGAARLIADIILNRKPVVDEKIFQYITA